MGHKKVCLDCRICLNREFDDGSEKRQYPCPKCGNEMILLPHRFRPPKKTEENKWKVVSYLITNGFKYDKVGEDVPENLREAKDFLKKNKPTQLKNEFD